MSERGLAAVAVLLGALLLAPTATAQFPDHDQVQDRLSELEDHPWVETYEVGTSIEGRSIQVAVATNRTAGTPVEDRAVTLVITQQHGDEPAGTPAALDVLERAVDGDLRHTLSNQVLVVLPMANPDGAEAGNRANANGTDINRDHVTLEEPEAKAIHRAMNRWDPDVALDHHEYGGLGPGNPVPVRTYDHDLTTLFPVHGNVRTPVRQAAKALMYQGIWPEAREAGYSVNEYGEVTAAGQPVREIAGGPDPGILRNQFGLHHVAGLLVESRIDPHPNPFHGAKRRIDIHRVVVEATLAYVHSHAEMFAAAPDAAAAEAERHPSERYVEGDRVGELAEAYRVADAAEVAAKLDLHDLPGPVGANGTVVPIHHAEPGHAAALVHPDSSRHVEEGVPTEMPAPTPGAAPASTAGEATPGWTAALAVVAVAAAALVRE